MVDDWDITHERADLPPEVWEFLKKNKFFGMIIPKEYGGLGFSALAHSAVLQKLAGMSTTLVLDRMPCRIRSARANCCCTTARRSRRITICRASPMAARFRVSR